MNETRRGELVVALERWVARLKSPDERVLNLGEAGTSLLSATEILEAVRQRTPDGEAIMNVMEMAANGRSFEELIGSSALQQN